MISSVERRVRISAVWPPWLSLGLWSSGKGGEHTGAKEDPEGACRAFSPDCWLSGGGGEEEVDAECKEERDESEGEEDQGEGGHEKDGVLGFRGGRRAMSFNL